MENKNTKDDILLSPKTSRYIQQTGESHIRGIKIVNIILALLNVPCVIASFIVYDKRFATSYIMSILVILFIALIFYTILQDYHFCYKHRKFLLYSTISTLILYFVLFICYFAAYYVVPIQRNTYPDDSEEYSNFIYDLYLYLIMEIIDLLFANVMTISYIFLINKSFNMYLFQSYTHTRDFHYQQQLLNKNKTNLNESEMNKTLNQDPNYLDPYGKKLSMQYREKKGIPEEIRKELNNEQEDYSLKVKDQQ